MEPTTIKDDLGREIIVYNTNFDRFMSAIVHTVSKVFEIPIDLLVREKIERPTCIIAESHDYFLEYCHRNGLGCGNTRYISNVSSLRAIRYVDILKIGRWERSPLFRHPEAEHRLKQMAEFEKLQELEK